MPVPRLIAAFITEGYFSDHVGTLNFSSHTSTAIAPIRLSKHLGDETSPSAEKEGGSGEVRDSSASAAADAAVSNTIPSSNIPPIDNQNSTDTTAATTTTNTTVSSSSTAPNSIAASANLHAASFKILKSLKDLSDEAQQAVHDLPCNTVYFMSPATRDMAVGVIRTTVPKKYLPLYSSAVTPAPFDSYIHQIVTLLRSGEEEIIIALVLLIKISTRIPICALSIARMFLTAMVVSSKLRADERISMRAYATFGGVEVSDMLAMERAFLTALGFDAGVRPEQYADMVYSLRHFCVVSANEGVDWIAAVWSDLAPRIPVPSLKHLKATPPPIVPSTCPVFRPPEPRKLKSKEEEEGRGGEAPEAKRPLPKTTADGCAAKKMKGEEDAPKVELPSSIAAVAHQQNGTAAATATNHHHHHHYDAHSASSLPTYSATALSAAAPSSTSASIASVARASMPPTTTTMAHAPAASSHHAPPLSVPPPSFPPQPAAVTLGNASELAYSLPFGSASNMYQQQQHAAMAFQQQQQHALYHHQHMLAQQQQQQHPSAAGPYLPYASVPSAANMSNSNISVSGGGNAQGGGGVYPSAPQGGFSTAGLVGGMNAFAPPPHHHHNNNFASYPTAPPHQQPIMMPSPAANGSVAMGAAPPFLHQMQMASNMGYPPPPMMGVGGGAPSASAAPQPVPLHHSMCTAADVGAPTMAMGNGGSVVMGSVTGGLSSYNGTALDHSGLHFGGSSMASLQHHTAAYGPVGHGVIGGNVNANAALDNSGRMLF